MTETEIKRAITDALEACGAIVIRMNAGRVRNNVHMAPTGTPDLLAIGRYRTYWIEVKRPGETLRNAQEEMIQTLQERGHEVVVATSIDDLPLPI